MKLLLLLTALTPSEFVTQYYPYAKEVEAATGLAANIILTQAAIETAWGRSVKQNNFFGVKGPGQLLKTVEYHNVTCIYYPEILSITKKGHRYRYVVRDYFRVYPTPMHSFMDFAQVIECSFPKAWQLRCEPYKFFKALEGKYATSPTAYTLSIKVLKIINREIYEYQLSESQAICDEVRL